MFKVLVLVSSDFAPHGV